MSGNRGGQGDGERVLPSQNPTRGNFDFNAYATKKSAAQSLVDVALLTANSLQLKIILSAGPEFNFYLPLIVLLAMSITLQVVVGLLLIFIAKSDLNNIEKHTKLDRMNNAVTICNFLTVVVNIFITALGFQNDSSSLPSTMSQLSEANITSRSGDLNSTETP